MSSNCIWRTTALHLPCSSCANLGWVRSHVVAKLKVHRSKRSYQVAAVSSVEDLPSWHGASAFYKDIYSDVRTMDYSGLRYVVKTKRDLFTTNFVSWLASMEKEASDELQDSLARCCITILTLTAEVDAENMKGVLPEIASTLASYNYQAYKEMNGVELPAPAKGAKLETLYTYSQQQEKDLRMGNDNKGISNPKKAHKNGTPAGKTTARPGQFADMASSIMARAKLRMQALQGQQHGVAQKVLDEFLHHMQSREERCTMIPEAMTPPGLVASQTEQGQQNCLHTSPTDLIKAIEDRLLDVQKSEQDTNPQVLASGEQLSQVLHEMKEDVEEYNTHIYSRLSKLEQLGDLREMF